MYASSLRIIKQPRQDPWQDLCDQSGAEGQRTFCMQPSPCLGRTISSHPVTSPEVIAGASMARIWAAVSRSVIQ